MAATFAWGEDTGTQTGSPTKGTTRSTPTNVNWKAVDTFATTYDAAPITDGQNSVEKWQFGIVSGTFNQVTTSLYAHTAGTLGTGLTLKGQPLVSSDGTRMLYTTPSQTTNAGLTTNMTTAIAIGSGVAVWWGITGPEATGKGATKSNPADGTTFYSTYLVTQLQTSGAAAGDTGSQTMTLQYLEN